MNDDILTAYRSLSPYAALCYITPAANLSSILQNGLLSHTAIEKRRMIHSDISMQAVQQRRDAVDVVPGKTKLHDYVNLYFDARNPMMYKTVRRADISLLDVCVVFVDYAVLMLSGSVVSDMNASSRYARFYTPDVGLKAIDFNGVYARYWTDTNAAQEFRRKSVKCAEALVLGCVEPKHIIKVVVGSISAQNMVCSEVFGSVPVQVNQDLFFQGGR